MDHASILVVLFKNMEVEEGENDPFISPYII